MKTINLEQLKRLNFINENAAMPASGTILGVDDLPTKVSIMLEGKVLEIIPAFTDYNMEQPKKKEKLMEQSDAGKRLDVISTLPPRRLFGKRGTRSLTGTEMRYPKIPLTCFRCVTRQTAIGGYSRIWF